MPVLAITRSEPPPGAPERLYVPNDQLIEMSRAARDAVLDIARPRAGRLDAAALDRLRSILDAPLCEHEVDTLIRMIETSGPIYVRTL